MTSCLVGFRKIAVSSAYMDVWKLRDLPRSLDMNPLSVACSNKARSGSIAITKGKGDKGSPCYSPLLCLMGLFGTPLRRILDEDV